MINLSATGELDIQGISSLNKPVQGGQIPRGIVSQTFNSPGANIVVSSKDLTLENSSGLIASTFGSGTGGSIAITNESTNILGGSPYGVSSLGSLLLTTSAGTGTAGNINLNTNNLLVDNGGYLISAAFRTGAGGNVFVNAADSINLAGGITIPQNNTFNPSSIASTTIFTGNAGNLSLTTNALNVSGGARVTTSTLSKGLAGKISITANNINLDGQGPTLLGLQNPSSIDSSAVQVGPFLQYVFALPPGSASLTGNSGEINLSSQNINLEQWRSDCSSQ